MSAKTYTEQDEVLLPVVICTFEFTSSLDQIESLEDFLRSKSISFSHAHGMQRASIVTEIVSGHDSDHRPQTSRFTIRQSLGLSTLQVVIDKFTSYQNFIGLYVSQFNARMTYQFSIIEEGGDE